MAKLSGKSKGRRNRRSNDPLGDPFAGLGDDLPDDSDDGDDSRSRPSGRHAGSVAGIESDLAVPLTPSADDIDLDLDLNVGRDRFGLDREKPSGVISRLFGARGGRGRSGAPEESFNGLRDIDGSPLRQKGSRSSMIAAGLGFLALVGGGYWLSASGILGGGAADPPPAMIAAGAGATGERPPETLPDRVEISLPPLLQPAPAVVSDATAATDRSANRRPWLTGTADAGGATEGGAPEPVPEGADAAHTDPGHDAPAPDMAHADPGHDAPAPDMAHADPTHADPGHDAPAPDMVHADPAHADPAHDAPAPDMAHADPAHADPAHDAPSGVRARVDLAPPDIQLPDVPGVLPVPQGVYGVVEPDAPNRLGDAPPVPSYTLIPVAARAEPLTPSPIPALQSMSPHGQVPRLGEDGRLPWQVYAAPDPAPVDQPRVAIVVYGLGMMGDALEAAVAKLPPQVSLSFSPYARDLPDKMGMARRAGHETLLDMPMEAETYPAVDPGPMGLLTVLPAAEILDRMQMVLAGSHGYVGVLAPSGGPFSASTDAMEVMLKALRQSGLLYVHQGSARALAANSRVLPALTAVDVEIDRRGYAESIQARLNYLTRVAKARGTAVGVMRASPLAFMKLREWADSLPEAGIVLAPVSAVVRRAATGAASGGGGDVPMQSGANADREPASAPVGDTHSEGGTAGHG